MIHYRRRKNNVFFLTVFIFLIHQQLLNLVMTLCPTSSLLKTSTTTRISSTTTTLSQQKNEQEDDFFFSIFDATEYVETEFDSTYAEAREQHNGQKQRQEEEDQISKYYKRDDDDDINIPVPDPIGLRKLLKIRFFANKQRNTTNVQQIDETLKVEHGVLVYDKPNVWTRQSKTKAPISEVHRRSRNDMTKLQSTYGPTGHPFQQYGGGPIDPIHCLLGINQIHNLLSRWIQCRNRNLYEEADAIRFELQLHGVYFDPHRSNLWRADGEKSFPPTADGINKDTNKISNPFQQLYHFKKSQSSTSVDPPNFNNSILNFTRIEQLVGIRSSALCRGENIKAKFLEYEVWKAYGIGIDDDTKTYFVASSSSSDLKWQPPTLPTTRINQEDRPQTSSSLLPFPPILFENQNIPVGKYEMKGEDRYSFSSNNQKNNEDFCDDDISIEVGSERQFVMERVQHLLYVRKIKLDERKFIEANAILYELNKTYGVTVNDKTLEWDVKNIN